MRRVANHLFKRYYQFRYERIEQMVKSPILLQKDLFHNLVDRAKGTVWGKKYGYKEISDFDSFSRNVPISDYEYHKPYIERMMLGERDILWPGRVKLYSKSSGTTSDRSKFIPVSNENFKSGHIRGTWDTMTLMYQHHPDCKIFAGKNFLMAGNHHPFNLNPSTIYGDVSALMIRQMPLVARPFFEPDFNIVLQDDWEEKIEMMAQRALHPDVAPEITMVGGVPTWVIVFFRHILEISGKSNMLEVWPNFEAYIHGGVSLAPYMSQFKSLLPSEKVSYFEVYNASEGYFGAQYSPGSKDMLLLLDNGVYYEFLPMEEWEKPDPMSVPLEEVELGKNYALIISTNAGLWRYKIGDTIQFTSLSPYLIQITGRTQQFVNVFGEEVMVCNTDKALSLTCNTLEAVVAEYTVAPIFFSEGAKAGHEWLIEFEKEPENLTQFSDLLDANLQKVNSDYEAKRYKDMALQKLKIHALPEGSFHKWLKSKGKLGGQNKVPRLSNSRKYLDEILSEIRA